MKTMLFLVIPAAFAIAQVTPQEEQRQKDLCRISGQLVNTVTKEPIRKGKVTLRPGDPSKTVFTANSDNEGKFLIENIDAGRYTLSAERQGFVNQNYGASRPVGPGSTLELKPGRSLTDLTVRMTPAGVIAGRVLDDEGEPMSGLTVSAQHYAYINGRRTLVPVMGALPIQTNDLGEYRISNLPPERYFIQSSAQKLANLQMGTERPAGNVPEEGYVPVYFPNSPDMASASQVDVAPGAEVRGIDLRLKKARVFRVSGKITNAATGEPVKNGVIMVYRRDSGAMSTMPSSIHVVQGGKGTFELRDVAPGSYSLLAMATGDPQNMMLSMSKLEVSDQPISDMTVMIGAGADIPVSGKIAEGVAVPSTPQGGKVDPNWDLSNLRIVLQVDDNPLASLATTQLDKDLKGLLKHVNPEKYKLVIVGIPPSLYLKSARIGDQDVLASGLDARKATGSLDLVLSAPAAELAGSVRNEAGEPVNGAIVTLVAKNPGARTDLTRTGTTDQNGQFQIRGAVPAEYQIFAWEDLEPGAADDAEFRKPFEKWKVDTDLSGSAKASAIQLRLITKAAVDEQKAKR